MPRMPNGATNPLFCSHLSRTISTNPMSTGLASAVATPSARCVPGSRTTPAVSPTRWQSVITCGAYNSSQTLCRPSGGSACCTRTGLRPFLETQRGLLDGVLCVSNALVELVSDCLPDLPKSNRVKLIPYPVDGLTAMPERAPLSGRTVVIGWVGRMQTEQKRVERLPGLAKALESAGIDFRFELLGDGPRQAWLKQQLPSNRTVFHGRKSGDEYWAVLRRWDFITSVSDYEGLPISMLEAFSAGVLPICPAIGSGGDEYSAELGDEFVWEAFDFGQAAAKLKSIQAKPESAIGQARAEARALTNRHSEVEYFRTFDEFVARIADEPRVSAEHLAKRPFYFSDRLPFGLMTRLWLNGCIRRNE